MQADPQRPSHYLTWSPVERPRRATNNPVPTKPDHHQPATPLT
jgi:hypothetical protein